MIVVPFIALCFSVPVAMCLCMLWIAATGHADLAMMPREAMVLAGSTALISLVLALLSRVQRR